jgi:dCMP deaminase
MLNDINFLKIAYEIASASKCVSRKTGAVIVKDGRIVSTGYNGTPA